VNQVSWAEDCIVQVGIKGKVFNADSEKHDLFYRQLAVSEENHLKV
jgi:hypothetical protein